MSRVHAYPGRLIFDHLPKTGGQAIRCWLTEALGSGCVSPHIDGTHRTVIQQAGGQYSILCSHVSFERGEGLDPRYQYATLLREPLDRLISWLYFVISNHDETELAQLIPAVHRFLDSEGDDLAPELEAHLCNIYVDHFSRVLGSGHEPDAERLALALTALRQYQVVGVHSDMPQFLAALSGLIGMPAPDAIAAVNVTRQRPAVAQLPAKLHRRLAALNALDLELYRQVCALVQQRQGPAAPYARRPWQAWERPAPRVWTTPAIQLAPVVPREGAVIVQGRTIHFDVDFLLHTACPDLLFGIHIYDADQRLAYGINSEMLGWPRRALAAGPHRITHQLRAALPAGLYTAGFAFVSGPADGLRELAWIDQACAFEISHDHQRVGSGYAELLGAMTLDAAPAGGADPLVRQASGEMLVLAAPDAVPCGQTFAVQVNVINRGSQRWLGDPFRPVMLSYHWLGPDGTAVVYEGLRTPLPPAGVQPGTSVNATMQVQAPPSPGDYQLVLTLVQEQVAWFEALGFMPGRHPLQVRHLNRDSLQHRRQESAA